jgi:transglutaminase-like putative cysteine protease
MTFYPHCPHCRALSARLPEPSAARRLLETILPPPIPSVKVFFEVYDFVNAVRCVIIRACNRISKGRSAMKFELDPSLCIAPTEFIESEHPAIRACVDSLDVMGLSEHERAVRLFEFVRDHIEYEFCAKTHRHEYLASFILADGKGFCVQKAVLLCALGRAAGLATGIVMADLRDHTFPPRIVEVMRTDTLEYHGLTAFYLDGRWLRADATLSPELVTRKGYRLVEFNGREEALLSETTADGGPHVEYVQWRGIYADLPYGDMMRAFFKFRELADVEFLGW